MRERTLYNTLKDLRISTLDLNNILQKIGIEISQRTLQYQLDNETLDDKIERVTKLLIKKRKEEINELKLSLNL